MCPIYDYTCDKCDSVYEIIKSIREYDGKDKCPSCGLIGTRLIHAPICFTGTKTEDAEYNVGLGMITKSRKHRDEIVKQKNLIEVGNENPDTIHNTFEKAREDKRNKAYDDI